jgi:hypothetical protein
VKEHVEMNSGWFLGHDHDDDVGDRRAREDQLAELIQRRGGGALAEAHDQEVGPQQVHVPALQGVGVALLLGSVVQQAAVGESGMEPEQRRDQ